MHPLVNSPRVTTKSLELKKMNIISINFIRKLLPARQEQSRFSLTYWPVLFLLASFHVPAFAADQDDDGIDDTQDNCIEIVNPDQRDSNSDGFGNVCDADLDNNGSVSFADLDLFRSAFGTNNADADFDGNGFVSFADLDIFRVLFGHTPGPSAIVGAWYKPEINTGWQIQLQERQGEDLVNVTYNVDVYDIDLFDTPPELFTSLKSSGKKIICYFSAGSYEEWRGDASQFNENDLGLALDDWPGERWFDIRSSNVRRIMQARLNLAKQKGCDGVDPDNVDGYTNDTGLPLTAEDQLEYNRFLADEAHSRGLAIGLKNDLDQIPLLVQWFDFSVNEQCHEFNECETLEPFISADKPVLNLEYNNKYINNDQKQQELCNDALDRGFYTLILPLKLDDSFRISCRN
jgi:hypothetical protein